VGAVIRPFGGWLADKLGGARVTMWNFIVMALAVVGVLFFLPKAPDALFAFPWGPAAGSFTGFFIMFLLLFFTTGIGNGSTFRMIPVIFLTQKLREVDQTDDAAVAVATKMGNTEGAASLGFTAAMAAYGGFFIPKSYGSSISLTGGPEAALYIFIVFYLLCIVVTWWSYARKNAEMPC
jgi:NNP family nitrate/nitrite transporter-like MFS transporter